MQNVRKYRYSLIQSHLKSFHHFQEQQRPVLPDQMPTTSLQSHVHDHQTQQPRVSCIHLKNGFYMNSIAKTDGF